MKKKVSAKKTGRGETTLVGIANSLRIPTTSDLHNLIVNTFTPGFLDALHKDTLSQFATAMHDAYQLGVADASSGGTNSAASEAEETKAEAADIESTIEGALGSNKRR